MKKLLFAVAVILISASVNAQDGKSSPLGFELGANVGTGTKEGYKLTYGANAQLNIPAAKGFKVTASAGYQTFNFKFDFPSPIGTIKDDFSFFLLFGGALIDLSTKLKAHGQLGYAVSTQKGGGGHFSFAPSLLYMLSPNLSLMLKYLSIDELNAVLLGLAFNIGKK
jgi:hypothetical protein